MAQDHPPHPPAQRPSRQHVLCQPHPHVPCLVQLAWCVQGGEFRYQVALAEGLKGGRAVVSKLTEATHGH